MQIKTKEPIRLRKRLLKSGLTSLYLDIYLNGHREYEYLHLYLLPEKGRKEKELNRATMQKANGICFKRLMELLNGIPRVRENKNSDILVLDYFKMMCEKRGKSSNGSYGIWVSALKHLKRYCSPHMTLREMTPKWVQGFADYLSNAKTLETKEVTHAKGESEPLSKNTINTYFAKLCACVNKAYDDGLIKTNPARGIIKPPKEETERVYLTIDEVKALAETNCRIPVLKNAFLFSCLTGLRKSDIQKIRWKEVVQQGDFTRLIFKQQKTNGQMYLDISNQAVRYMGKRQNPEELVFGALKYSTATNMELKRWAIRAGVSKDITFHSGRHTFAVMMLDIGTDIYTVRDLLGHKELQTTQVYAKILDKNKQNAVAKIPTIINENPHKKTKSPKHEK